MLLLEEARKQSQKKFVAFLEIPGYLVGAMEHQRFQSGFKRIQERSWEFKDGFRGFSGLTERFQKGIREFQWISGGLKNASESFEDVSGFLGGNWKVQAAIKKRFRSFPKGFRLLEVFYSISVNVRGFYGVFKAFQEV